MPGLSILFPHYGRGKSGNGVFQAVNRRRDLWRRMHSNLKNYQTVSLDLVLEAENVKHFFPLLQRGFMFKARVDCSIKAILCEQVGLNPEYVEDRVKTIFLDGKTVDDMDSAVVKDGSTLALSAAMPGLVGAILRRGGHLALLRSQATYREENKPSSPREGLVVLKLFNLIVEELGPLFLKAGIFVRGGDLKGFFLSLPEEFWVGCKTAKLDGQEVGCDHLREMTWLETCDRVMMRVKDDVR